MKFLRWAWSGIAIWAFALVLSGCGGGSSSAPTNAFAGFYTGSYAGTTATGSAISGKFSVIADASGNITGTLIGATNSLPVTGTVDATGNIRFSTPVGANVTSIAGNLTSIDGTIVGNGTFTATVNGVANASSGRITAIRVRTASNPFFGNYKGTFISTTPAGITGTFDLVADANGSFSGVAQQTGKITPSAAAGFVTPAGKVTFYVVSDNGASPHRQIVSTFLGNVTSAAATLTVAGNFGSVEAGSTTATGTFTGTRQ